MERTGDLQGMEADGNTSAAREAVELTEETGGVDPATGTTPLVVENGAGGGPEDAESSERPGAPPPAGPAADDGPHSPWLLIVCCVAQFMVILDLSIVNVALPSIQSSLGFNAPNLQWVVDAYAITFAGFLMLGGRASDRFGPRRMLAAALVLFALASLVGGAAPSQSMLIIARSAQ